MPSFKDKHEREWTIVINGPTIKAVREECKVDPIGDGGFERISEDDILLVDVLTTLCAGQFVTHGLTPEQFASAVVGEAIDAARAAYTEALLAFSPPSKRGALQAVSDRVSAIREQAMQEVVAKVNSDEFGQRILAAVRDRTSADIDAAIEKLRTL